MSSNFILGFHIMLIRREYKNRLQCKMHTMLEIGAEPPWFGPLWEQHPYEKMTDARWQKRYLF